MYGIVVAGVSSGTATLVRRKMTLPSRLNDWDLKPRTTSGTAAQRGAHPNAGALRRGNKRGNQSAPSQGITFTFSVNLTRRRARRTVLHHITSSMWVVSQLFRSSSCAKL